MSTVLSNPRNTKLSLIAAVAIALVVILSLVVVPSISAPRPGLIPVTGISEGASDYYLRHRDWTGSVQAVVPVTRISESTDYFQRHPELSSSAAITMDMSDYFTRHPELRTPAESDDLSDYFLRH